MAPIVRPGLRLDRDRNSGWGDCHRVDVSSSPPPQRVTHPPALRLQRCEHTPDLVLRACPDATPASQRELVAGAQAERNGDEEQPCCEVHRAVACGREPEQRDDDSAGARFARTHQPAVLQASGVVHAPWPGQTRLDHHGPMFPPALDATRERDCEPPIRYLVYVRTSSRRIAGSRRPPARATRETEVHRAPSGSQRVRFNPMARPEVQMRANRPGEERRRAWIRS